ncbi:hypothetical protein [Streptomyces sp. NPDC054863]
MRRLFEILSGPAADRHQSCAFYRGLRLVAVDGTTLSAPDEKAVTWRYHKHIGKVRTFGYPLIRMVALVECGTRALLDAVFGPDDVGELAYACRLLGRLDAPPGGRLLRRVRLRESRGRHPGPLHHALYPETAADTAPGSPGRLVSDHHLQSQLPRGRGYQRLEVRVVEAWITGTLADGTRRTELWRLLTDLLDSERHPAADLIELCHRR